MKKTLLLLFCAIAIVSCSTEGPSGADGPQGPQGPQGPAGEPGSQTMAKIVDLEGDFTEENSFSFFLDFEEEGIEVFDTDIVLVYTKVGENGTVDGQPVEVWRQLPQTYYTADGEELQYNFDYTFFDCIVFLDGSMPYEEFSNLDPSWTEGLVFRIAVVPADFAADHSEDLDTFNSVMTQLNKENLPVKNLNSFRK